MSDAAPTNPELLTLLARTTDNDGWLAPLLSDSDSATVIKSQADIFAYVGTQSEYNTNLGLITKAPGGVPGTSNVTVSRTASGTSGTIPTGYRFIDSRGLPCIVVGNIAVSSGITQLVLPVMTLRQTELVNTVDDPGFAIDPANAVVKDSLGTTVLIAAPGSTGIVSTTFTVVVKADPISGGSSDFLSVHGDERGQPRQPGETTDNYRARVRNIPDAVSPIAISDAVQGAASTAGLPPFNFVEPFEDGATPALKAAHHLTSFDAVYMDDGFMGDGEVVDARSGRAYFRLEPTGPINNPDGSGLYLGDGFFDDPVFGFADTGQNPTVLAALMSVWEEANRKRAGGVQFDVDVATPLKEVGVGSSTANTATLVWSLAPASGKVWLYVDSFFGHDFALAPQPASGAVAGAFHRIRFTFSDATTFTLPDWTAIYDQQIYLNNLLALGFPMKPITLIEGFTKSDGTYPMNLVGTVYVFEMAT
jgi:hypothetical protein